MKVKINVVSRSGHDELLLETQQAISEVQRLCEDEDKWLYIDGTFKNSSKITASDLEQAQDITLTNRLIGG